MCAGSRPSAVDSFWLSDLAYCRARTPQSNVARVCHTPIQTRCHRRALSDALKVSRGKHFTSTFPWSLLAPKSQRISGWKTRRSRGSEEYLQAMSGVQIVREVAVAGPQRACDPRASTPRSTVATHFAVAQPSRCENHRHTTDGFVCGQTEALYIDPSFSSCSA